jgi:hypothetical protein
MTKHLTTAEITELLQWAIAMLTQIHNEHALEIVTCTRLLREKDERIAYLEQQMLDVLNLTAYD